MSDALARLIGGITAAVLTIVGSVAVGWYSASRFLGRTSESLDGVFFTFEFVFLFVPAIVGAVVASILTGAMSDLKVALFVLGVGTVSSAMVAGFITHVSLALADVVTQSDGRLVEQSLAECLWYGLTPLLVVPFTGLMGTFITANLIKSTQQQAEQHDAE